MQEIQASLIEARKIHDILRLSLSRISGFRLVRRRLRCCLLYGRLFIFCCCGLLVGSNSFSGAGNELIAIDSVLRAVRLTLLAFLFLLGLGLRCILCRLLDIDGMDARLVLAVRHLPERCHLVDRRDEERVGRHLLDARRHSTD